MTIEMKKTTTNRKQTRKSTTTTQMIVKDLEENPDNNIIGDFKCKKCERRFKTYQALGGHQASHSIGLYRCKVCSKGFDTGHALGGHMRLHKKVEKAKNVIDQEEGAALCLQEAAVEVKTESDLVLTTLEVEQLKANNVIDQEKEGGLSRQEALKVKTEGDLVLTMVEEQRLKAEEDERIRVRRELILGGKE